MSREPSEFLPGADLRPSCGALLPSAPRHRLTPAWHLLPALCML